MNKFLVELTSEIVAAYVANNSVEPMDMLNLIRRTHEMLSLLTFGAREVSTQTTKPIPAVPISASIRPDFLICLEDGNHYKSLKRHLRARYGMSPEQYRVKWGLPQDYPMVAPNYARHRSGLAKSMGLGRGELGRGRVRRS